MKTRLISVACMLPFVIFLGIGKLPLLIICFLLSAAALYEFYRGFEKLEIKSSKPVAAALLVILYIAAYAGLYKLNDAELFGKFISFWLFIVVLSSMLLIIMDKNHNILGPSFTLIGIIYIAYNLIHVALIERYEHALCWMPIIIAIFADTGGYFGGMFFGKHKLCPTLSPKKTVEGAVSGVLLGTISSIIFGLLFFKGHLLDCVIIGIIGSAIAEIGDLVASAFKRKMGIKDYSNLIPGHGGVLDRVDSYLFISPFVYYYLVLICK